jgi:hypothetical protein
MKKKKLEPDIVSLEVEDLLNCVSENLGQE